MEECRFGSDEGIHLMGWLAGLYWMEDAAGREMLVWLWAFVSGLDFWKAVAGGMLDMRD